MPHNKSLKLGCLLATCTLPVAAQPLPLSTAETDLSAIVVTGTRLNLSTTQGIKRDKIEIVDSIVADDIAKLPDFSVTEALQRVTGVQISRDRGEGGAVSIRGLTQMETTLNGREIFTAGWGRNLDFNDIAADLVAGIDVYKTSSADHIEGGVGGRIDLRTRRPFDFNTPQAIASIRSIHGDLVDDRKNQFSLLLANRWNTTGIGELGMLLNLAVQERAWREDQKSVGAPRTRTDLVPGQTVLAPNGTTETASLGTRKREGAHLMLQWRPSEAFDLYAEASHAQFRTLQNSYQFTASAPGAGNFVPGSVTLFPGTNDVQNVTWTNASFSSVGAARDTIDRTSQFALGGNWTKEALTLKADLSYTKSHNNLNYTATTLNGTAPTLTQNLSGSVSGSGLGGLDLLDLNSYTTAGIFYARRPFNGNLKAGRLDGEYHIGGDLIDSIAAGLRLSKRHATSTPGQVVFSATVPAGNAAGLAIVNPIGNFFPSDSSVSSYLLGNPDAARNVNALSAALGINATIPSSNPVGIWNIDEDTRSAYAMINLRSTSLPLDGNLGLRAIRTHASISGYRALSGGGTAPIAIDQVKTDLLPSLNLRYELSDGLYLRSAASKTLTRPDFNQMSPSLTLNSILQIGSAGNPALQPVRADNLDIALERYFGKTTALHATAFIKKIDGFVLTRTAQENWDGIAYQVSRPYNANTADIRGLELGYQQFYDFLPAWLRGFGLQANYTFIDSETFDAALARKTTLQNISRHSFNLVGIYERGPYAARLAWNWRDKFLSGTQNVAGFGVLPVYTKAYGWLDASLTWRAHDRLTFTLEGLNLLRTRRTSYYGVESRPKDNWLNDRQLAATVTLRY